MDRRLIATKFVSHLLSEEQKENLVSARHVIFDNLDVTDVVKNELHCYALVYTAMDISILWKLMNILTS
jgi:hypothetical protein